MKRIPEYVEGPESWDRFNKTMKNVLAVPHSEVKKRIEQERKKSALNPVKRGPKRKTA